MPEVDIDGLSVSQLRAYLREAGADTSGCFEKVSETPGALTHDGWIFAREAIWKPKRKNKKDPVERHSLLYSASHTPLRPII